MIVGTKDIDLETLRLAARNINSLRDYAEGLVPRCIKHISEIVNNQKYLVALHLREIRSIPYKRRIELCDMLLKDVSITGVINTIVDFNDILMNIDMDMLIDYLEV